MPFKETQENVVKALLEPGESISWMGEEPRSRYQFKRIASLAVLAILTVFTGSFTILMVILNPSILRGSITNMLPVLIPFVISIACLYSLVKMTLGLSKGGPDLYVVTNRRAILIERGREISAKSYGPEVTPAIEIQRKKNGSGKIIFERKVRWDTDQEGRSMRRVEEIGFFGLESVDEVLRHLKLIGSEASPALMKDKGLPQKVIGTILQSSQSFESGGGIHEFHALETTPTHERLYKIYLVEGQVCGAKIAGSLSSASLFHMGRVSGYGFLFAPIARRIMVKEQEREARFKALSPLSDEFLKVDKDNFRLSQLEIEKISVVEEHKTLSNGYNTSGRVEFHLRNGKSHKFWLTLEADPCQVARVLQMLHLPVELSQAGQLENIRPPASR